MLNNETWLDCKEALEMGFATKILEEKETEVSQSVKQSLIEKIKNQTEIQKHKEDKKQKLNKVQHKERTILSSFFNAIK